MGRALSAVFIFVFAFGCCFAEEQESRDDSTRSRGYGPYEARGTVQPMGRQIPLHQHLWKVVEYPTECTARLISLPLAGMGYLFKKEYEVGQFTEIFYFDNGQGYLFPSCFWQTDRGAAVALEFDHRSVLPFGTGMNVRLCYGGRSEHEYRLRICGGDAGDAVGGFALSVHDLRRPDRWFYGLGIRSGHDDRKGYLQEDRLIRARWSAGTCGYVTVGVSGTYRHTEVSTAGLGLESCNSSAEQWGVGTEIVYDDRPYADYSAYGWRFAGSIARILGSREIDSDYWRYTGSIQRQFNVYRETRVVHLSVIGKGIRSIGDQAVPFWNLPILGGDESLRGFPADRFRDRVTLVFTAQYRYPIFRRFGGSLFIDCGSAAAAWEQLESQQFKIGYGWELESHLDDNFSFRLQLAHSGEGLHVFIGTQTAIDLMEKGVVR
jgi:hypothetical protein